MNINIGEAIRQGLKKKKITQQELAETMGKSQSSISEWINNRKRPSVDDLFKLADMLDIISDLFPGYVKREDFGQGVSNDQGDDRRIERIEERLTRVEKELSSVSSLVGKG